MDYMQKADIINQLYPNKGTESLTKTMLKDYSHIQNILLGSSGIISNSQVILYTRQAINLIKDKKIVLSFSFDPQSSFNNIESNDKPYPIEFKTYEANQVSFPYIHVSSRLILPKLPLIIPLISTATAYYKALNYFNVDSISYSNRIQVELLLLIAQEFHQKHTKEDDQEMQLAMVSSLENQLKDLSIS